MGVIDRCPHILNRMVLSAKEESEQNKLVCKQKNVLLNKLTPYYTRNSKIVWHCLIVVNSFHPKHIVVTTLFLKVKITLIELQWDNIEWMTPKHCCKFNLKTTKYQPLFLKFTLFNVCSNKVRLHIHLWSLMFTTEFRNPDQRTEHNSFQHTALVSCVCCTQSACVSLKCYRAFSLFHFLSEILLWSASGIPNEAKPLLVIGASRDTGEGSVMWLQN